MEGLECEELLLKISKDIKRVDYCKFKPKEQMIDLTKLKTLYDSLRLNDLIKEFIDIMEEIII